MTSSSGRPPLIRRSFVWLLWLTGAGLAVLAWYWDDVVAWRARLQADQLFRTYRDTEALGLLRKQVLLHPDNPQFALQLVRAHRRTGDLDKALILTEAAAQLGASAADLELERKLITVQSGQIRDFDKEFARLIVERADIGSDIFQAYVLGLFANLRTEEALGLLDGWQKSSPGEPQPSFLKAYLLQGINQLPGAIEAYKEGLKLAPQTTLMRRRLAEALIEAGDIKAARSELRICALEQPDDIEVNALLAQCEFSDNDLGKALAELDRVLTVNPAHTESRRLRGQIRLASNEPQAALEDLMLVVQLTPDDTVAREALGRALQQTGQTEQAKRQFEMVAAATKEQNEIVRLIRQVIETPNDAELRFDIGSRLIKAGSMPDGVKWLRTVLEINPEHAGARELLAQYYSGGLVPHE